MCSCCSGLPLSSPASSSQLALVEDAFDAIVGVGLLILVDPSGWDPFG
jgi:hypothetical protein